MKTHIYTLLFAALYTPLAAAGNSQDLVRLTFDNTTICVPHEYVPGLGKFGKYLKKNVKGLDNSDQSQTIRLPAKLIMAGVKGYRFSHINKYKVNLEHKITGIANGLSEVTGKPVIDMPCKDDYDLGYCYQRVVYKSIFFSTHCIPLRQRIKKRYKNICISYLINGSLIVPQTANNSLVCDASR